MPNQITTNKLTDLVALRFLVNSSFLNLGSKQHFKDQMVGKRAGQEYTFVIRDAAPVYDGNESGVANASSSNTYGAAIVDTTNYKNTIVEREVKFRLRDFAQPQDTNLIEAVTDMNWDKEVATPNGAAMAQKVVRAAVNDAIGKANVAIVGAGFQPLAEVAAHLTSISSESLYGFVDPKIQAVLTANGQQFNPVGSPDDFYKKGLLGEFHSVEYHSQRFFPVLTGLSFDATAGVKTANAQSADSIRVNNNTYELDLVFASADNGKVIKAGTPFTIDGIYATDLIGDPTAELFAFIVSKDVTIANGAATITFGGYADSLDKAFGTKTTSGNVTTTSGTGARIMAKADGGYVTAADLKNKVVTPLLEAGATYWMGQVRLDGNYEFCTLDKLDSSNAESKLGKVENVAIHENRIVDVNTLTNTTRWDVVAMFGTIDIRGVANIYFKA